MVPSVGALQRFVYERLGLNKDGFILHVKVRLTCSIYSVLHTVVVKIAQPPVEKIASSSAKKQK